MKKDKIAQSKIVRKGPPEEAATPVSKTSKPLGEASARKTAPVLVEINQEDLDKKIEAALSEDLTK